MLKSEEKSLLVDVSSHEGFKVLMRVIDLLAADQERRVHTTPIQVGKETEVLYAKARAEGARRLQVSLLGELKKYRTK